MKKGTVISFSKDGRGAITTRVNELDLNRVQSAKLCEAIFDLYVGDQPVSAKARRTAGESFLRMRDDAPFVPPPDALVCKGKCRAAVF